MQHMSGWVRALLVVVLYLTCVVLCWYAVSQYSLRFQIDDLALSLDTSRGREAKQQYEYEQVVAQLPLVQAQLEELEPQAAEAQAREKELRARRKELRAEVAQLEEQLAELQTQVEELQRQLNE